MSLGDDDVDTAPPAGIYDPVNQGSDFWESLEGMRVTLEDVRVTSPFHSNFDEQFVTPNVGANPSTNPRGGLTISDTTPGTTQPADKVFDFNPERIQLDDEAGVALPTGLQTGDRLGDVTGVVNYANGQYEVNTTEAYGPVTAANLEKETTTIVENLDRIRVATFNVENLAPVGQPVDGVPTPASKFAGLAAAIVNNLKTPEIIALQEVLDNDGATASGTTSASETLSQLIDAIVAAGGPRYVAINSPPIDNIGGIPNGNQRVAYLYDPLAVSPTSRNGLTNIVSDANGVKVQEFASANQIGQGNTDFTATRKSLPMEWSPVGYTDDQGGTFWTVNNHLSSKGGSAPLYTTLLDLPLYADPINGSAQQTGTSSEREGQAETLNAFVDGLLTNGSATDDRIVVLGDLNDFQFFPVVDLITGQLVRTTASPDGTPSVFAPGTAVLSELISKLPENERYSYNFDGNAQALDHILVSNNMFDSAQFDIVHINSEFIDQVSDHDPSVSSLVMSRSAAIATGGNDVFDQAAYTARFGTRGSLAGDDTINGLGGDDRIAAGSGNDIIDGGTNGATGDVAVFTGARSSYTVTVQGGSFVFTDNRTGASDGIDIVTNVERFEFADRTVTAAELTDTTGPTLTAATPADNAAEVAAGNNIVLTFNEAVAAGTGNIVISNGAGDTRTIAIGDTSQVAISGNTVTINPTADLAAGSTYDVTLASGVITDVAGNAFGGIAQNDLDFTVAAGQQNYRLQLLHFSDGEASLLATKTAKNLAALVDAFEDQYANTLVLSGGDNFLAGPFLAAGTDPSVRAAINAASGSTIAAGVNVPIAAADISILNAIGVEASTIGNHEFDLGSRVLRDSFTPGSVAGYSGANFVYLTSNLDFSGDADLNPRFTNTVGNGAGTLTQEANTLKGRIAPAVVITEGSEKIGLVGATTQVLESISSPTGTEVKGFPTGPGANGEVNDMVLLAAQLQPIIDELIAEGVNKIIVQSHLQQIQNEKLLATLLRGVDIILSAGSDTRLADADDELVAFPGHSPTADDTYPLVTTGADGGTTLIVNTDNEYTYLGRLVVDFDSQGRIVLPSLAENQSINGAYASTAENVAEAFNTTVDNLESTAFADGTRGDKVRDVTDAVQAVINVKDGNLFGFSNVYLEGERAIIRNEETNLGDVTADANAAALRDAIGDVPFVISLKNGGGIRSSIGTVSDPDPVTGAISKLPTAANPDANKPAGAISQLDIENSLRFDNKLMAFDTTVQGLLNILNWGAGLGPNNGGFPQIGGVAYSYDPTLPGNVGTTPGSRIRDLALIDEDGNVIVKLVDNGVILQDVPSTHHGGGA